MKPPDLSSTATISWEAINLHAGQADSRYGVSVYFNGNLIASEIIIRAAELNIINTVNFIPADQGAVAGSGFDNYVELRGTNYNADGGGNWMGYDYIQLDATAIPEPSSSLLVLLGSVLTLSFLRRRNRG